DQSDTHRRKKRRPVGKSCHFKNPRRIIDDSVYSGHLVEYGKQDDEKDWLCISLGGEERPPVGKGSLLVLLLYRLDRRLSIYVFETRKNSACLIHVVLHDEQAARTAGNKRNQRNEQGSRNRLDTQQRAPIVDTGSLYQRIGSERHEDAKHN